MNPRLRLFALVLLLLLSCLLPSLTIGQSSEDPATEAETDTETAGFDGFHSTLDEKILSLLSPDQIQAFIEGTPPEQLYLSDGRTLAELLADYGPLLPDCSDPSAIFCDGFETGQVDLWAEVLGLRLPPVTVQSSPAHGEAEVAVTRETILHFSSPLPAGTVIDKSVLFAEFAGQDLPARIHLSPARDRVTLFYDQGLPASARIRVRLVGDALLDAGGNAVDADGDGEYGGTAVIDFDTLSLTSVPGTRVCGSVFASELMTGDAGSPMDQPLNGVAITVDGQESVLFTHTDNMGNFCLDPAPAGRFFVHIDGRTATNQVPTGAYYPFVGKAWDSVVGQEIHIGNVYLPLVVDGTLQNTSMEEETEIELADSVLAEHPELEGTLLMVPPDSLYSDDGTRGGMVGIAPVAPDRLPGTLPEGLNFPLVITVQTDGATNFDNPAPICFPNLPDPTTGEPLEPGQKSALWSFNHDTGRFEVKGPMTVTDDGSLVCTDEGVGVEAPGWHGTQPGTQLEGGADNEPDDGDPCADPAHRRLLDTLDPSLYPQSVQDALAAIGGEWQVADDPSTAAFTDLTFDEYSVVIGDDEFPAGFTPQDFVREFLRGPNEALNNGAFNTVNQFTWQGTGPQAQLGDVYDIDIFGPDNGSVMLTALNDLSWQFSIINTSTHGQHPLYGAREFGFEPLPNGDWKFYTKGFSKPASTFNRLGIPLKDSGWLAMVTGLPLELFNRRTGAPPTLTERQEMFMSHPPTHKDYGLPEAPTCAGGSREPGLDDGLNDRLAGRDKGSDSRFFYYRLEYSDLESIATVRVQQGVTSHQGYFSGILPSGVHYNLYLYNPESGLYGYAGGQAAVFGVTDLGMVHVDSPVGPDSDGDGLGEVAEFIVGTDPGVADSDADGTLDGAEINQGTDPLDGLPVATGILASVDTPGEAVDVCASDNVAVIADSQAGISVLNVFNDLNPTIVAQVDTPGDAQAVTCSTQRVVVADGSAGLAVIDVSDPPAAFIVHQVPLSGSAQAVRVAGNLAFVGTTSGQIAVIELGSGSVLQQLSLSREIQDLAIAGETLYALTTQSIHVMPLLQGDLRITSSVSFSGSTGAGGRRLRLFAGGPVLYAAHTAGYDTYDISDPLHPQLIAAGDTDQFGWKQIVTNGSGLGIAAVSPNSTNDGPHHVSVYDVRDPSQTELFLAQFETPGLAAAVSVFNGLAYVADSGSGLQVLSYLAYDNLGMAPTIALDTNFSDGQAEEGKLMRLTAEVGDDVQVRHVEFFVDGESVSRDGNFPFEYRFLTPLIAEQASFTIQARATDTGGNVAETAETVIALIPDATPPQVIATSPRDGGTSQPDTVQVVSATFSEPIDDTLLDAGTFRLFSTGPDGLPGTGDDVAVVGAVTYEPETRAALLSLPAPLGLGTYRAELDAALRDLSGNPLDDTVVWDFSIVDGTISSVPGGGNWSDVATWTEGRLPNAADLVSIRGTVTLDINTTVSGLTVAAGATLQQGGSSRILEVTDRTVNHGALSGAWLNLRAFGDVINNGVWTADLVLDGPASRSITGAVPIDGEVELRDSFEITEDALFNGPLDLNFFTLTLNAPTTVTVGGVESTGTILGGGTLGLTGSIEVEANAHIVGNVLVQPGTFIQNREDYARTLSVEGDFTNLGTIQNHAGGGSLTLEVGGSIVNEGPWIADLDFIGNAPRSITGEVPIGGRVELRDSFEITEDALFTGLLDLNFFTLTLNAPTTVTFGGVESTGTIVGGGTLGLTGAIDMEAGAYVAGNVRIQPGTLLQNREDYARTFSVEGDFTNLGTIQNHPGGGSLTIEVGGSILNEGPWTADLDFIGTDPRSVTGAVSIAGRVELRDSFEITEDALFTGPLDLNFFTLTLDAPTTVTFGGVESTGTIIGGGTLGLTGAIDMQSGATVDGNVLVQPGTLLRNRENYTRTLSVEGNFTNYGTIQDHPGGGSLMIEVGGSIVNEGPWTADLDMIGTDPRSITGAVPITARVELNSSFEITNDAVFAGPIDLNFFSLTLNSPRTVTFGGVESTGTLIGGGTLRLAGAVIDMTANAYVTGNLAVAAGTTLQNQVGYARQLYAGGDFANHGTIQEHAGGGSLSVKVGGSIVNEGSWTADLEMVETQPRSITGSVPIAADIELGGSFEITNDAVFAGSIDLNFHSITRNAPGTLTFGGVTSTGTIIGGGTLRLAGATIDMAGNAYVTGHVAVTTGTILQNQSGYARALNVDGDLTNNGTIRHHPDSGSMSLSVTGTLTNNGTITATINP